MAWGGVWGFDALITVRPCVAHRPGTCAAPRSAVCAACARFISIQVDTPVYLHIRHYTDRSSSSTSEVARPRVRGAVRYGTVSIIYKVSRVFPARLRFSSVLTSVSLLDWLERSPGRKKVLVWKNELLNLIKNRTSEARRTSDKRACGERVRSCAQLAGLVTSGVRSPDKGSSRSC